MFINRRYIILVLAAFILISCKREPINWDLYKEYISSYSVMDQECVDRFRHVLEPYSLESDQYKIGMVYEIFPWFDTTIYEQDDYREKYFIGVEFEPDSFHLAIFCLDLSLGTIAACQEFDEDKLLINNCDLLFTDLTDIAKKCYYVGIKDSESKYKPEPTFRYMAWTNKIYGSWRASSIGNKVPIKDLSNTLWKFKREKSLDIYDNHDELINMETFEIENNQLILVNSKSRFDIITLTRKSIILEDNQTGSNLILRKE